MELTDARQELLEGQLVLQDRLGRLLAVGELVSFGEEFLASRGTRGKVVVQRADRREQRREECDDRGGCLNHGCDLGGDTGTGGNSESRVIGSAQRTPTSPPGAAEGAADAAAGLGRVIVSSRVDALCPGGFLRRKSAARYMASSPLRGPSRVPIRSFSKERKMSSRITGSGYPIARSRSIRVSRSAAPTNAPDLAEELHGPLLAIRFDLSLIAFEEIPHFLWPILAKTPADLLEIGVEPGPIRLVLSQDFGQPLLLTDPGQSRVGREQVGVDLLRLFRRGGGGNLVDLGGWLSGPFLLRSGRKRPISGRLGLAIGLKRLRVEAQRLDSRERRRFGGLFGIGRELIGRPGRR